MIATALVVVAIVIVFISGVSVGWFMCQKVTDALVSDMKAQRAAAIRVAIVARADVWAWESGYAELGPQDSPRRLN